MLLFAIPMILGDLLQQCYNIADTLIVGKFLGRNALAAVGSSFTLMTFLTSIILGLCMGSGALFSMRFGEGNEKALRENLCASFFFIAFVTVLLNILSFLCLDSLRTFLQVPLEVWSDMRSYLFIIFLGIPAVFLYNYFSSYLRAIGNSVVPLWFLAVSAILNIILDLWFVIGLHLGVGGAAEATVIAQNYGAKKNDRIRSGLKSAVCISMAFCIVISAFVFIFAKPLMSIFVDANEIEIIQEGVRYLRIEGAFYCGIGCLFLLYGLYRALGRPGMSVVLTVISLGTRVVLAYILSSIVGVCGIWWSVPIGWVLADFTGLFYYKVKKKELLF